MRCSVLSVAVCVCECWWWWWWWWWCSLPGGSGVSTWSRPEFPPPLSLLPPLHWARASWKDLADSSSSKCPLRRSEVDLLARGLSRSSSVASSFVSSSRWHTSNSCNNDNTDHNCADGNQSIQYLPVARTWETTVLIALVYFILSFICSWNFNIFSHFNINVVCLRN